MERLPDAGHAIIGPGELFSVDEANQLLQESKKGELIWGNIFNDNIPVAGRKADNDARQATYSCTPQGTPTPGSQGTTMFPRGRWGILRGGLPAWLPDIAIFFWGHVCTTAPGTVPPPLPT